jgi:hypothetical protein
VVNLTWNGAAAYGTDYTVSASGGVLSTGGATLTLAAGVVAATLTVTPVDDAAAEAAESVSLTIAAGTGYVVGTPASASGSIADNDQPTLPVVSVTTTDASGAEQGQNPVAFTVTRTGSTTGSLAVSVAFGGTAASGDYTLSVVGGVLSGTTLTLAAGSTSATVTVTPVDDSAVESTETVTLSLPAAAGYTVGSPASASGSIADNDQAALPSLSIADVSVVEGNNGNRTVTLTVTKTGTGAATVSYATANGTATAGSDYVAKTGTLSFAANETSKTISITINGDRTSEPNETFVVNLSNPSGATLADGQAIVTITNDDGALVVSGAPAAEETLELDQRQLDAVVAAAQAAWIAVDADADYAGVTFAIGDLPGLILGLTVERSITIDANAAGWGWSRLDLLTVVRHELGHVLGLDHDDADRFPVMAETLSPAAPARASLEWIAPPAALRIGALRPHRIAAPSRAVAIRLRARAFRSLG